MTCTARSQMLLRVMHGLACHTEGGGRTTSPSTSLRSIEQGLRQGGGWRRRLPPLRSIEAGGREGGGDGVASHGHPPGGSVSVKLVGLETDPPGGSVSACLAGWAGD